MVSQPIRKASKMAKHPTPKQTEETANLPEVESPETVAPVVEGNVVMAPMPQASVVPTYDTEALSACQNLSQKIRYLNSRGLTISQIVKVLKTNAKGSPLIYQHVRNVLKQSRKTPA